MVSIFCDIIFHIRVSKNPRVLKQILQLRKTKSAIAISIAMVGIFGVMQAMETQGANTSSLTLSTTVQSAISVTCSPTAIAFGNLISGTPIQVTSSCSVSTNAANGYTLKLSHDDATGTMKNGSTYIPDAAAWTSGTPNSAVWGAQQDLAFRVLSTGTTPAAYSSAWWGTDDTAPNAKYAGLPAPGSPQIIVNDTAYSSSATTAIIAFKVDVPSTQSTLTYSGNATILATASP